MDDFIMTNDAILSEGLSTLFPDIISPATTKSDLANFNASEFEGEVQNTDLRLCNLHSAVTQEAFSFDDDSVSLLCELVQTEEHQQEQEKRNLTTSYSVPGSFRENVVDETPGRISPHGPDAASSSASDDHRRQHTGQGSFSTITIHTEQAAIHPRLNDVLCGRGSRSNHHPGNQHIREEAYRLQNLYWQSSRPEKKAMRDQLFEFVQNDLGGRFLKQLGGSWVEISNQSAKKKCQRLLSQDNTPAKREARRAQYGK